MPLQCFGTVHSVYLYCASTVAVTVFWWVFFFFQLRIVATVPCGTVATVVTFFFLSVCIFFFLLYILFYYTLYIKSGNAATVFWYCALSAFVLYKHCIGNSILMRHFFFSVSNGSYSSMRHCSYSGYHFFFFYIYCFMDFKKKFL